MAGISPSQTVGPFFAYGLTPAEYGRGEIAGNRVDSVVGERIRIEGRVLDGDGEPVPDAMLEFWQADAEGRFAGTPGGANAPFTGFARTPTGDDGGYWLETVRPGRVAGPDGGLQAPHINVTLFARGLLCHLFTRIYFADEQSNTDDPILAAITETRRRQTLIAARQDGDGGAVYRFDIRLQGEGETVFFQW